MRRVASRRKTAVEQGGKPRVAWAVTLHLSTNGHRALCGVEYVNQSNKRVWWCGTDTGQAPDQPQPAAAAKTTVPVDQVTA